MNKLIGIGTILAATGLAVSGFQPSEPRGGQNRTDTDEFVHGLTPEL